MLYQIKSAIAKLLVSFLCQVNFRERLTEGTTLGYGCNPESVVAQEWNSGG